MTRIADMTDEQLERRVDKHNRRVERQNLQRKLISHFSTRTAWGYRATFGAVRAGAKLLSARIVAAKLRDTKGIK